MTQASGKATVYSYTVVHRAPRPDLAEAVPYVVALVDLEEGVRLMTNVVRCATEDVRIGMAVSVTWKQPRGEPGAPVFQLDGAPGRPDVEQPVTR